MSKPDKNGVPNTLTTIPLADPHARAGDPSVGDLIKFPGMDDPREPESWNPKLHFVREIILSKEPEVADFPRRWRLFHRVIAHSTTLSRMASFVLHYRF